MSALSRPADALDVVLALAVVALFTFTAILWHAVGDLEAANAELEAVVIQDKRDLASFAAFLSPLVSDHREETAEEKARRAGR